MTDLFNSIAAFFQSNGIHPVLGAFIAGFIFAKIFRARSNAATVAPLQIQTGGGMITPQRANVSIQTTNVRLDGVVEKKIMDLIHAGKTIEAIKELRAATGYDLKAAKDLVEALGRGKR